ncbi:MAG: RES domain-containing protein [Bacteroidetes bacterium]|nr:RES domain-containing protein [Bacteroidota bacterium]
MDEFSKDELTLKEERLKDKIQAEIHYCLNCQPRDSGEWIWVFGVRYDIEDLFDDFKVEKKSREKIIQHLICPNCGTEVELGYDIGLEDRFDKEIRVHLSNAERKYGKKIERLSNGIRSHPTIALSFPLAKSILREIKNRKLPCCSIQGDFYRSRKITSPDIFSLEDFLSPPTGKSDEGRFNHSGQSHLYIAEDQETAIIESLGDRKPSLIWMQKFSLKKIENILDLSYDWDKLGPSTSTLLVALHNSSVLQQSINNKDKWKPDYYLTRFIMDCAKISGYNGIKYNSTKNHSGINIVLFEFGKGVIESFEKPEVIIYNPESPTTQFNQLLDFPDF